MRPLCLLLAPLAFAPVVAAGCGANAPTVPSTAIAVVGDRTVTRAAFDELMTQARQSYARQGRPFPAAGTKAYVELKAIAVRLLVERAELDQEAPGLGVTIDGSQVEARHELLIEDSFGGDEDRYKARLREERMTDAQVRSALRAQLLSAAVFQAVTADVTVSTATVQSYYEDHIGDYSTAGRMTPFATVRETIRARLLAQKRTREFNLWLAGVRSKLASRTAYATGFAPPNGP